MKSRGASPVTVPSSPVDRVDTRFAVVTMTRMPYRFEEWLSYYRALGTDHLFIAVEESPEVESLLAEAPWCDMVTTSRSKPEQNPYETVITRQERVMAWALGECESRGIPWLFHLDDDELLHFGRPWEETVAQVPPDATCLVVRNVEGVPDNDHSDFTTISRFAVGNETGWPMLAYINGKAAGRVGACSEMGPHRFTGAARPTAPPALPAPPCLPRPPRPPHPPPSPAPACREPALRRTATHLVACPSALATGVEWEAPLEAACVLHFESCPYSRWEEKFTHYAATTTSNKNLKAIPFDFYVDSIKCCRQHAQAPPPQPPRGVCVCALRLAYCVPAVYLLPHPMCGAGPFAASLLLAEAEAEALLARGR